MVIVAEAAVGIQWPDWWHCLCCLDYSDWFGNISASVVVPFAQAMMHDRKDTRMRWYRWLICLVVLAVPATVLGQRQEQLHWEQYDNVVQIQADGSVRVQEQQQLVVDDTARNRITRTFTTGSYGRVSDIEVTVDGQRYRPGSDQPGTFSGGDNSEQAQIRINYADPRADQHSIVLAYTLKNSLISAGNQATLDWEFFWEGNAPEIRNGSVTIRFPETVPPSNLQLSATGVPVRQTSTSTSVRWELTQPIRGQQLDVVASFPRAILAANAQFRGAAPPAQGNPRPVAPGVPAPAPAVGVPNLFFCFFVMFMLFIAFSFIRASARGRRTGGYYTPTQYGPDPYGPDPYGPLGGPFGGRRRRRRRYGGWGGGWGGGFFPPIIIPPSSGPSGPSDPGTPFDSTPPDTGSGGGFNSWGDSGGDGSSWGDSGGGFNSWGDSGGGGSSWGGGGGGGGDGGGGGGGDGGGSFG